MRGPGVRVERDVVALSTPFETFTGQEVAHPVGIPPVQETPLLERHLHVPALPVVRIEVDRDEDNVVLAAVAFM